MDIRTCLDTLFTLALASDIYHSFYAPFYGLGWGRGSGNSSKMYLDLPRASTAASTQSSACHLLQVASCASFLPYIKGTHLPRHIHMGVIILQFSTPSKSSTQARAKPSADKRKRDPVHKQCSSPPPELSSPSPVSSLCFFKLALLWATSSLSSLSCFARQPFHALGNTALLYLGP